MEVVSRQSHCFAVIPAGIVTVGRSLFDLDFDRGSDEKCGRDCEFIGGKRTAVAGHVSERMTHAATMVRGRKLLDVGCDRGALLMWARDRGWTVCGTELDPQVARELSASDVQCFLGELDCDELRGRRFDIIHMNHVLEHVRDPISTLAHAAALLERNGMIIVEVPNEFSAASQRLRRFLGLDGSSATSYFQHEWFFSRESLATVCSRAGLCIVKLRTPYRRSGRLLRDAFGLLASILSRGDVLEAYLTNGRL